MKEAAPQPQTSFGPPPAPPLWRSFLTLHLPLLGVLLAVGALHYHSVQLAEESNRMARESLNVGLARRMLQAGIGAVVSDLRFLAEHLERQAIFQLDPARRQARIELEFEVFASNKRLYDQIRLLDPGGQEAVRINFDGQRAQAVGPEALQDKSERYYFRQALALGPAQIYLSPLDLNMEEGRIETPLKPTMRFATPVFDRQGVKRGLLVLNYLGEHLLDNFVRAAANIADHVQLVNSDGYWLRNPDPSLEWGRPLGTNANFARRDPHSWARIGSEVEGQFQGPDGLITFATVAPHQITQAALGAGATISAEPESERWHILAQVPNADLAGALPRFLQRHASFYALMLGLLSLGAWLINLYRSRHRQAEARNEYERSFRRILETIGLAAVSLDRHGRVSFCNDHFLRLTGWKRHQVQGHPWVREFVPQTHREGLAAMFAPDTAGDPMPPGMEAPVLTADGSQRLIAWHGTRALDAAGRPQGITGIGADVTEQRRAEAQLRKLSRAVEQSPSIVVITDRSGLIEYVNPKFSETTGYRAGEVLGRNPRILKSGETSSEEYGELWRTLHAGGEWRGEFHNRKKNGELYWEAASISAIRDPQGQITHFVAVKEDITERKRLESEVAARNRELAKTQTLAALGRMASMIAHDLCNPLSSVKMTLQILSKPQAEAQSSELRSIALEQIRYMEEILSDLLTYARPDALKADWISLDKLLDTAIGITQRRLDANRVRCDLDCEPGLPPLYADATKLRQVFSNLIANAAQATEGTNEPGIRIRARAQLGPAGSQLQVEVCDNGCGIAPEARDKLFEPFFTTRAKGTGLGLAIVKRILDQHGAAIEVRDAAPGTCGRVTLPTVPPKEPSA